MYNIVIVVIIVSIVILLIRRGLQACRAAQQTDWGSPILNYLDGLNRLFCQKYHRFQFTPIALPVEGAALVVSNHTSGLDAFLLVAATQRPLRFLIAREEYERFGLKWLFKAVGCIPVDRSKHPEQALRTALRSLEMGEVIALFPQGRIVLPHESVKLKRGSIWLAQQSGCPIFPAHISGVRSVGSVFTCIVLRGHTQLISYPTLNNVTDDSLPQLKQLLENSKEMNNV